MADKNYKLQTCYHCGNKGLMPIGICILMIMVVQNLIVSETVYERMASLFSALLGIISTIAFGVWVSYIFQRMNDISTKKKNDELIETIREREFSKLRFHLSSLVRHFHTREDQLLAIQSFIKADFIPYYKKDNFWTDMQERDEAEKEFDSMVDDWMAKYKEKAAEKLKTDTSTPV